MKSKYLFSIALLAVLAAILAGLAWLAVKTPLPAIAKYRLAPNYPKNYAQSLNLSGLKAPATVVFDDFGIPHIEAENLEDLMLATGFVQARYRGFQMDLFRRIASGRLAELFGNRKAMSSSTVEFDLGMRGWAFEKLAGADLENLPEQDRAILQAFSDGVNQAFELHPSIEHAILQAQIKPWTPQDTLLVGLLQAWSLTHNWEQEALRLGLALELGSKLAMALYPPAPVYDYGTVPEANASKRQTLPPPYAPEAMEFLASFPRPRREHSSKESSFARPEGFPNSSLSDVMQARPAASNAWVVSGEISASGAPILHNDMHLTHSLPSMFFLQHLKMPGLNAVGGAIPGIPFLLSGYNGHVAWGVTSAVADVVDLVLERIDPNDPNLVLNQSKPCPLVKEQVTIAVKGEADQTFTIRRTCNGPIFNDMYPGFFPDHAPLTAIRFKLPKIQESMRKLLQANQSKNVEELREALMQVAGPIQNIMAADHDGNIAFFATGFVPKRQGHRGAFPVPGWLKRYEWQGAMSVEEMPHSFNPEQGFLANANNLARPADSPKPIFQVDAAPSHRFDRIVELLSERQRPDQKYLREMQKDSALARAQKLLPKLLKDLENAPMDRLQSMAYRELRAWDLESPADSKAALLFTAWYRNSILAALGNKVEAGLLNAFLKQRYSYAVVDQWLSDPQHPVWDNPKTTAKETRSQAVRVSFRAAIDELKAKLGPDFSQWKWGKLHYYQPSHPFGGQAILSFFNLDKTPMSGGLDSVWKAHMNFYDQDSPYKTVAGPVYIFSVDLANPESAGFSTDSGASGWPLSPHYSDQYQKWRKQELIPIERDMDRIRQRHPNRIMELLP